MESTKPLLVSIQRATALDSGSLSEMMQYGWLAIVESDKYGPGSLGDKEFVTRWPVKNNKDFRWVSSKQDWLSLDA
jgi:hypothetical protein